MMRVNLLILIAILLIFCANDVRGRRGRGRGRSKSRVIQFFSLRKTITFYINQIFGKKKVFF